jgi:hypothetical protein
MAAPLVLAVWLSVVPALPEPVCQVWDGLWRLHTWVTLRLMGFQAGPAPLNVGDGVVAALPERESDRAQEVPTVPESEREARADAQRDDEGPDEDPVAAAARDEVSTTPRDEAVRP